MSLSVVAVLVRNLIAVPAAVLRGRVAKDAEVLALRHENAVLRCQISRVRYEQANRIWLGALGRAAGVHGGRQGALRAADAGEVARIAAHYTARFNELTSS
jgi:hypothetical protein